VARSNSAFDHRQVSICGIVIGVRVSRPLHYRAVIPYFIRALHCNWLGPFGDMKVELGNQTVFAMPALAVLLELKLVLCFGFHKECETRMA